MDDLELLRLAAIACGLPLSNEWDCAAEDRGIMVGRGFGDLKLWNPLANDGDALRIAVNLHLDICFYKGFEEVQVQGEGSSDTTTAIGEPVEACEPFGVDLQKATRRAIVRAAAEVGRSMS